MDEFATIVIGGLRVGSIYSLVALGFLLVFQVSGIPHLGAGQLAMFAGFLLPAWAPTLSWFGASVIIMCASVVTGLVTFGTLVRPAQGRGLGPLRLALALLGVGLVLEAIATFRWKSPATIREPIEGTVAILGARTPWYTLCVIVFAAVLVMMISMLWRHTDLGRQMTAVAYDHGIASLYGVDARRVSLLAWGLSAALFAVAGLALVPMTAITVGISLELFLKSFAAWIVGGVNSIEGVAIGAMTIGILETSFNYYVDSRFGSLVVFGMLFLFLVLRPQGLFGGRIRAAGLHA